MVDKSDRNWLIRTKSMQILGPVSIAKIIELLEKNSLRQEDEITSGNGYWFGISELDLVERYVKNREVQPFNPIAEAKSVLAKDEPIAKADRRELEEEIIPLSQEDLEYPDMSISLDELSNEMIEVQEEVSAPEVEVAAYDDAEDDDDDIDDVTMVATGLKLPVQPVNEEVKEELPPPEIEIPEIEKIPAVKKADRTKDIPAISPKKSTKKSNHSARGKSKNDRYLFVLLALVVSLIVGVIYYYRTILNRPLPGFETSWLIDSAYAQNTILSPASKKKSQ